jgi:hypothetical protein
MRNDDLVQEIKSRVIYIFFSEVVDFRQPQPPIQFDSGQYDAALESLTLQLQAAAVDSAVVTTSDHTYATVDGISFKINISICASLQLRILFFLVKDQFLTGQTGLAIFQTK